MPDVSVKYEPLWKALKRKMGGPKNNCPPVYETIEDTAKIHRRLNALIDRKAVEGDKLFERSVDSDKWIKSTLHDGGAMNIISADYDRRLLKPGNIYANERYWANVYEMGVFVPSPINRNITSLHELIHCNYVENHPEIPLVLNFPKALFTDESTRIINASYFANLNESLCWLATIKSSELAGVKEKVVRKNFKDSMKKAGNLNSQLVSKMVGILSPEREYAPDMVDVVQRRGVPLYRAYIEAFDLGHLSNNNIENFNHNNLQTIDFMRKNFDISVYRIEYDGSLTDM